MTHILTGQQFADKTLLDKIFAKTSELEAADKNGGMPKLLAGKVIAAVFYEPSTRTRLSFESAALKLGAGVISVENAKASSSDVKGESLEDTVRMVSCYADLMVLRHPEPGTSQRAAKVSEIPIINGGDGPNEHPTQALYDVYTVWKRFNRLSDLKLAIGFDPKHSRTEKSFCRLMLNRGRNKFIFVCPEGLEPEQGLQDEIIAAGSEFIITRDLSQALEADIFYTNRLQQERFVDAAEFERLRHVYCVTKDMLLGKKVLIMNPLPRVDEISPEVDGLPNAIYFEQAKNGLYIRAALLLYALGLI